MVWCVCCNATDVAGERVVVVRVVVFVVVAHLPRLAGLGWFTAVNRVAG